MTCLQNSRRDYRVLREEKNSSSSAVLDSDASWQIFSPVRPTSSSTKASCSEQQQYCKAPASKLDDGATAFVSQFLAGLTSVQGAKPGKAWPLHAASQRFSTLQYKSDYCALPTLKERRSRSCPQLRAPLVLRSHSELGAPLALALSPIKSAARFAFSKKNWFRKRWTIFLIKITKWQLCGHYTYMVGTRTKIVHYQHGQHGYFGPPTQFSPYFGRYSFLIHGLSNFESAKEINERRSQHSAFFESATRARAPTNFSERRPHSRSHI